MKWRGRALVIILILVLLSGLGMGYRATLTPVTLCIDGECRSLRTHQPTVGLLLADLHMALRPEDNIAPNLSASLMPDTVVNIDLARPIILVVDGREQVVYAHDESPVDLLSNVGVFLDSHDTLQIMPLLASDPPDTRFRVVVKRAVQVVLEEGATRTPFYTDANTVGEALLQAGIYLYRADKIYPAPATPVLNGMHIQLERSTPVSLRLDGHTLRTRTHRDRVAEVLADMGVTLNGQDYTVPPLDTPLNEGIEIRVVRVTESVIVEQSPIPFETVWQPNPDLEIDNRGLIQEGEPGVLERRIRLRYEDQQVVDRWVEGESVVQPPSNRINGYGTKIVVRALPEAGVQYWRKLTMLATSYSASTAGVSKSSPYYGRTATGLQMRFGLVAVDPNVIPLGTEVYVPGYGVGLAADTGGGIRGKQIDLGYDDDNLKLWYAWVDVYLLTPIPDYINYLGP